jgi:hypothetical protein
MKKILIVSLLLFGCFYEPHQELVFHNNTPSAIYVATSCLDSLTIDLHLSLFDTIKSESFETNGKCLCNIQSPNYRINAYLYVRNGLYIKNLFISSCVDKKIRFFFIKESIMRKYSWNEICKYQLYEKKLTFTEKDLRKNNWVVVYE